MSLLGLPIKTAILIRGVIITAILAGVGYVAEMSPTPELVKGITNGLTLIPAAFIFFGLICITLLYRITPQKLEEMQAEIKARKAKQAA